MFYNSSKRISRRRTQPLMDNNNHNYNGLLRNKFWFIFITLFFFWYLLLYGFDWSSLPLLSSLSRNQEQSLDSNSNPRSSDILSDSIVENRNDDHEDDPIEVDPKQAKNAVITEDNPAAKGDDSDDGGNENAAKDDAGDDDNVTMEDVQDLERELESVLPQEEPERPDDANTEKSAGTRKNPNCKGRYVYMHDIPARYNSDYVKNCRSLNKWHDMCQYFANSGLGQELGNPQRLFSSSGWYVTNQFSLELIFHNRMKRYECLTNDSSKATAFFVPYYAGLDVARYLWDPQSSASARDSDLSGLFAWLRSRPEWARTGGRDHFLMAGRITWDFRRADEAGWGNKLMLVPEAQNMTMLTIESSPWDKNDFAVPYPTYFHPSSGEQVAQWQNRMRRVRRRALFCFAGAPRPGMPGSIRGEIMEQCSASSSSARRRCRMLECKDAKSNCLKPANLMKMFQGSTFCLQPPGDSFTRRSTFDSILAGCIPVFFHPSSAYVQYLWHLPRDFGSYSVLIPEDDVKGKRVSIERALSRVPRAKVSEMRENVIRLIPRVVYADPRSRPAGAGFEDAFDLTVRGVVERVERLKKSGGDDFDAYASWKYYAFGTTKEHERDHYFRRGQNYSYNS